MNNNLVKCSRISVDCVANDPVDVRCGGPAYLGFDFNVKTEKTEEMKTFIDLTLKNFKIPLEKMYVSETVDAKEENVWTKEKIVESISNEANHLLREAAREYGSFARKIRHF